MYFYHLSDLHIKGKGSTNNRLTAKAVERLLEIVSEDDIVIISGDVIEGEPLSFQKELELAYLILSPLLDVCTVMIVPGNHDVAIKGILHHRKIREAFGKFMIKMMPWLAFDFNDYMDGVLKPYLCKDVVMGIDTTGRCVYEEGILDLARGGAGHEPLRYLSSCGMGGLIVVGHHGNRGEKNTNMLVDGDELVTSLKSCGAKMYLCGHKHVAGEWYEGDVRFIRSHKTTTKDAPMFGRVDVFGNYEFIGY